MSTVISTVMSTVMSTVILYCNDGFLTVFMCELTLKFPAMVCNRINKTFCIVSLTC